MKKEHLNAFKQLVNVTNEIFEPFSGEGMKAKTDLILFALENNRITITDAVVMLGKSIEQIENN